jgi:hypothetical protein
MVVIVPDPVAKPLMLIAAQVYCKSSTDQLTNKRLAAILAAITASTPFKAGTSETRELKFRHVVNSNGNTISVCIDCGDTVANTVVVIDIEASEQQHQSQCSGPITA